MIAAVILVLVVIAYRVILGIAGAADPTWLHNFSPLAALVLCGAIYFPRRVALALPFGALLVSDLILNASYHLPLAGAQMIPQYVALGLVAGLGWLLRGRALLVKVYLASAAGSLLFYVITNTGAWWFESAYAKTGAGWVQALTSGEPGHPPTLLFFRNSLASDLIFTGLFLLCLRWGREEDPAREKRPSLRAEFARRLR